MEERQRKNEASVHRTAKEFTVNRKSVHECYSTMKGQTECLENATVYAVASLCQLILTKRYLSFWRTRETMADPSPVSNQLLSVCRGGVYSRDKLSVPAYNPPPTLSTSAKVAKQGVYMWETMVLTFSDDLISHHGGFFYREKIFGTSVNEPYTLCTVCSKCLQLLCINLKIYGCTQHTWSTHSPFANIFGTILFQ